jgi:hypothetical protein
MLTLLTRKSEQMMKNETGEKVDNVATVAWRGVVKWRQRYDGDGVNGENVGNRRRLEKFGQKAGYSNVVNGRQGRGVNACAGGGEIIERMAATGVVRRIWALMWRQSGGICRRGMGGSW